MLEWISSPIVIRLLGLAGSLSAVLGALIAGVFYRGKMNESYSIFRHFISELGEVGTSRFAWVFNLGLILCGLCLLPCCIGLGILLPGIWSSLGMFTGVIAAVSVALVGVFPMNKLTPHTKVAMTFFRSGLVMVLFFTMAILFQPVGQKVLPRWISLVGVPAVCSYAFFILYSNIKSRRRDNNPLDPSQASRPRFWVMAFSEWMLFLTTIPWFFAISLGA